MLSFDPALLAEIAYRRDDVRTSFRRSRRLGARTATSRRAPRTVAARTASVTGAVTHRTA